MKLMKAILVCLALIMFSSTTVLADDNKVDMVKELIQNTCKVNEDGTIKYTNGTVKAYVREKADASFTQAVTLLDGQTIVYYNASSLETLYKTAQKLAENDKVGEKVNDITNNLNIAANTEAASIMLGGFKPILELGIGIIVVMITFGMTLFSAFDICYIAFPVFRNKMEEAKDAGSNLAGKKSANGEVSLRWVTEDAQYAVKFGAIDSGKSPWTLYFKKRVASYIFLAITLFVLLTGNISLITNIAINIVSGIIDILSGLAS